MSTWTRVVIAFDLAAKLTDGDGDTAMDEKEPLAQHGFADYTLAPETCFLTDQTATAVGHEIASLMNRERFSLVRRRAKLHRRALSSCAKMILKIAPRTDHLTVDQEITPARNQFRSRVRRGLSASAS
jgi:hypothetical protein